RRPVLGRRRTCRIRGRTGRITIVRSEPLLFPASTLAHMSRSLAIRPWAPLAILLVCGIGPWACGPSLARADEGDDQYAVAAAHYSGGRWKLAAEEFQTLVDDFPEHPRSLASLFYLAEAQTQLGDY